jgi:DNA-binding response OmpR family regulator
VLHFLILHVGQVISRERLLSEIWGYDFDPGSNVVDVCVQATRARVTDRDRAQRGLSRS